MKPKLKFVLAAAVIAAAAIGAYTYLRITNNSSMKIIHVSGNIEATEVRLSFQVPGKISELLVDEGYAVKKGQIVARLDKEELTQAWDNAQAALEKAQANYKWVEVEYRRAENLLKTGAMTTQQRDNAKNQFEIGEAELKLRTASLAIAKINLGYADLNSPVDGFVLVKSAEAGEIVQASSTVFTVADLNDVWLTAYIIETDLGRVKLNQQVSLKTDTYPGKEYTGRVSFISQQAEFTPKQIQTPEERVKLVYRIKIVVTNTNQELKPGMPADGYIKVE
jgi:HlyD family secretion protein